MSLSFHSDKIQYRLLGVTILIGEDSIIVGCNIVLLGMWFQTFQRIVMVSVSGSSSVV